MSFKAWSRVSGRPRSANLGVVAGSALMALSGRGAPGNGGAYCTRGADEWLRCTCARGAASPISLNGIYGIRRGLMTNLRLDDTFLRALPADPEPGNAVREVRGALWSEVMPTPVPAPKLLAWSREMAMTLGFDDEAIASPEFAELFAGNRLLAGMRPYATNYGGHQFGQWA